MTTIGLLGDVMLGRAVGETLADGRPEDVFAPEVRELLAGCDLVVLNLECCVCEGGAPTERIAGKPFFFRAPPAAIGSLQAIGASAVSLANNHSLDYEVEGMRETLERLDAAGIAHAGAGVDRAQARAGAVIEADGVTLGLVASADHPTAYAADEEEPGIALIQSSSHRGARWRRPPWLLEEIGRMAARCDHVLAFPHWGPNMTTEPAHWQRLLGHRLIGAGAGAVAGHSAHVFHGVGWSGGRPILYDLGDALDDYAVRGAMRNDLGLLALWRPGEHPEMELVGLHLDFCVTRLADGEDAEWIASRLERACGELGSAVERLAEQRFAVRPA